MMESSNLDHHHHEHQQAELLHGSPLPAPDFYFHGSHHHHEWSHNNLMVNNGDHHGHTIPIANDAVHRSSRDIRFSHDINLSSLSTPMVQELGLFHHWDGYGNNGENYINHSAHQAHDLSSQSQIKEEFSDTSTVEDYSSFGQMISGLHPLPRGPLFDLAAGIGNFGGMTACSKGNFGVVLPTTNILGSNGASVPVPFPISLNMDLQALDILASSKFGRSFCQPASMNSMALFRDHDMPLGLHHDHLQQPAQGASNNHHKVSSMVSGVAEKKRPNSILEQCAASQAAATKKPRVESRSSFSPIKVRKEKLADRIAALQQLVSPFGKTDTASVLMEAIGYINFLQDQVETLSVPYMRSSGNKSSLRAFPGGASGEETRDEPKPDLRSRGLCLVPLSCTSYVTNENGGFWSPPPNFGGT